MRRSTRKLPTRTDRNLCAQIAHSPQDNNIESCTTYNALKLGRALFTWSLDLVSLAWFERAKHSGMHGTAHPSLPGRVIYMLPTRGPNGQAGGSKRHQSWVGDWSDPHDSMWCCVGTAMESHSKHGGELFFEQAAGAAATLLVTIYDDASVSWAVPGGGGAVAIVTQRPVYSSEALTVTVSVSVSGGGGGGGSAGFALALRIPGWAVGASAAVNGQAVAASGAWFNVSRSWAASGDAVVATFPFVPLLEPLDDDRAQFANYRAVTAGPFALGALTLTDNLIIGADAAAPPWVRPLTAGERASALSLGALPGAFSGGGDAGAYIGFAFDNSSVAVRAVNLGGAPTRDPSPTYAPALPGFLPSGGDVLSGVMTLAQALANCTAIVACVAVTFEGPSADPPAPTLMYLKAAATGYAAAANWSTIVSSRWRDPFGGDEDGPDTTWLLDPPLFPLVPAETVSLRALSRPGEFLACGAAAGAACAIAHDTSPPGSSSAAFNASASFVLHVPGLTGQAGTLSLESAAAPGTFVSFFGAASPSDGALSLQALQPGAAFANASTFARTAPNWAAPAVAFVAETRDASQAGSRDLLLVPVADIVSEWYGVWVRVNAA